MNGVIYGFLTAALSVIVFFLIRFINKVDELEKDAKELLIEEGKRDLKIKNIEDELDGIKERTEIMWAFQIRRAYSEVLERKLGTMDSPLKFTEETLCLLEPFKPELIDFWGNIKDKVRGDGDALLEIEKVFGDRLLHHVCRPLELSHGACLLLAYAVARDVNELDIVL